jgi:molecular chaperone GrpE (heat shock protein)
LEDTSLPGDASSADSAAASEPAVEPAPSFPAAASDTEAVPPAAGVPGAATLEPAAAASVPAAALPDAKDTPSAEAEWVVQIKLLHRRLDDQERLAKERERIIDRLHEENQRLKQGELLKQMMPVYRDLMRLYDDLKKTALEYSGKTEITAESAAQDWDFFATAVTDLLYRYGVEVLPVEPGTLFDPKCHRAAIVQKTSERDRDKTVARVLSAGFAADNKVLRAAGIEVFRYDPSLAAPPLEETEKGEEKNV